MSEQSPANTSRPWWVWLNVLGVDAVLTALLWMPLFGRVTGARLIPAEYAVLACAVWSVYTLDRMMDGLSAAGLRSERHIFAARRWLLLGAGVLLAAGCSAWLLGYEVREIVSRAGLKLMAGVACYFGVTWAARRNWAGLMGALTLGGVLTLGLMQGAVTGAVWPQMWRGALAGFLITVLYLTLRKEGAPAPWILPRKLLGGWLFGIGTALVPYAHLEMWRDLIFGSPVLLFGGVCALNSTGIRLWETEREDFETGLLCQLYPWMLAALIAGAGMEWVPADAWSRPLFAACGVAAFLLMIIHACRRKLSVSVLRALADGAMIFPAAITLWLLSR